MTGTPRPRLTVVVVLAFGLIAPMLPVLEAAVSGPRMADDARRFLFWMVSWRDPRLFDGDYIANFYQALSPAGYRGLYWLADRIGIAPISMHLAVPVVIAPIATYLIFRVCAHVGTRIWHTTLATAVACANMVASGHIYSGTPRAFPWIYLPLFLLAMVERKPWLAMSSIMLAGLFYPVLLPVLAGALIVSDLVSILTVSSLRHWLRGALPTLLNLALAAAFALYYLLASTAHGGNWSYGEARALASLQPGGRNAFFPAADLSSHVEFWLWGRRSGVLPYHWIEDWFYAACVVPVLFVVLGRAFVGRRRDAVEELSLSLFALLTSALVLWALSHLTLFRGYLPSRFTEFVLCLIPGPALAMMLAWLDPILTPVKVRGIARRGGSLEVATGLAAFAIGFGLIWMSPRPNYVTTMHPRLHQYLRQQMPQPTVASLEQEVDNIPAFGVGRILVGREFLYSYNKAFHRAFGDRVEAVVQGLAALQPEPLQRLKETYGVTHILLDERDVNSLHTMLAESWAVRNFPSIGSLIEELRGNGPQALLAQWGPGCVAKRSSTLLLIDVECVLNAASAAKLPVTDRTPQPH